MGDFKDSKTYANLMYAFAGESQARNKYTYFASAARKEGYEQIAATFENTANNEKEHAELWFKALGWLSKSTAENLVSAAAGEHEEWTGMYKEFAEVAAEEGYADLAVQFELIGSVEKRHEERYLALLANLKDNRVFNREHSVRWECRNCGFIYEGESAPTVCPACKHPRSYFELEIPNY